MPVTLKELAARAGVHPSTISRVVNNDAGLRIGAATRARIEALLRETKYRPDGVARSLKLRQTFVLAVVIPDVTNPLFAALYRGVEDAAGLRGYSVILCNTDGSGERERAHVETLQARRVDGVVLASAYMKDPTVQWLRQQRIPHVLLNRFSDEADPFVGSDDLAGGKLATAHLISLGHKRIGHLAGPKNVSTSVHRQRGYLAALAEAGLPANRALIAESGFVEDGGLRAMEEFLALPDPPTAVFAVTDLVAVGAYTAAARHGIRIPDQLAVVGYNDIPLASRISPAMTTVHLPLHEFGTVSAGILIDQIESGTVTPRRVLFRPQLVVRESTQPGSARAARSVLGEKADD